MENFKDYAKYYDLFYKDKDYRNEARLIDILMSTYGNNIHNIMVLGCGSGKHDEELVKLGYHCDGIDLSEEMIVQARNRMHEGEYEVADVRNYEPSKQYDAVISMFHVMSYQNTNSDLIIAFKTARKCLPDKGGVFIFDVWYGPGVLSDLPEVKVKEVDGGDVLIKRIANPVMYPNDNLVDVNYEVIAINKKSGVATSCKECHKMRYFFKTEIRLMLEMANMRLVDNFDGLSMNKPDFKSWTSTFVAVAV